MMNNQELSPGTMQMASAPSAWHVEPGIDSERQQFLWQQLLIIPNIHHSIYPFKDIRQAICDISTNLETFK